MRWEWWSQVLLSRRNLVAAGLVAQMLGILRLRQQKKQVSAKVAINYLPDLHIYI